MNTDDQLALLRTRSGEPESATGGRYSATQLLSILNSARRTACEETRCYQIKDSQTTVRGTRLYSVANDFIGAEALEYDGLPLTFVRPQDWRHVVGSDDTLEGTPVVYTFFARQFQLFWSPNAAKTLLYRGWGFAASLTAGGVDAALTDDVADKYIWLAAAQAKGQDERNPGFEWQQWLSAKKNLQAQYMPKPPRYIRPATLAERLGR